MPQPLGSSFSLCSFLVPVVAFVYREPSVVSSRLLVRRASIENSTALPSGTSYLRSERPLLPRRTLREKRRRLPPLSTQTAPANNTLILIKTKVNATSQWTLVGEFNQNITSGQLKNNSMIQPVAICISTQENNNLLTQWTAPASSTYNCRACPPLVLPTSLLSPLPPDLTLLVRMQFYDHADSIEILDSQSASQLMLSAFVQKIISLSRPPPIS